MKTLTKTLAVALVFALTTNAQATTIIGGATGNGDFNAGGGGLSGGAQTYDQTANWFNAQALETVNFTNSSQMGGSTDPDNGTTRRGGMPFSQRAQINDTSYTIGAAGEVFDVSYDFGAGGGAGAWATDPLPDMTAFLFTSTTGIDGNTVEGDMTVLAGSVDSYAVDRANDGQWTSHSAPGFYTSTAADIGKTVYFGMKFLGPNNLFPRIDSIQLDVAAVPEPSSIVLGIVAIGICIPTRVRG